MTKFLLALIFAAQLATTPEVRGDVEGTVVQFRTGAPLAAVRIEIASKTAYSDNSGRFVLDNVAPGTYPIYVGMEPQRRYFRPPQGGGPTQVTMRAGQHISGLDFFLIPAGAISGRITDSKGSPLVDLRIAASTPLSQDGRLTLRDALTTQTNDRGEYRFSSLEPAEYYIHTVPDSFDRSRSVTYFPGTDTFREAKGVVVKSGEEYSKADFSTVNRRGGKISGTLTNPGSPEGLNLSFGYFLLPRDNDVVLTNERLVVSLDRSTGKFTSEEVLAGSYDLLVWGTNRIDYTTGPASLYSPPKYAYSGKVSVTLSEGQNLGDLDIVLLPAIDIKGRVVFAEATSTTWTQTAQIYLQPLADKLGSVVPRSVVGSPIKPRVGSNGGFTLQPLPRGKYGVFIEPLPEEAYIAEIVQGGASLYDQGVEVGTDPAGPLEIIIRAKGRTITGTVANADKSGVPYTTAVLVPDLRRRSNPTLYKTITTDKAGAFIFQGIAPGKYEVFAWESMTPGAYLRPEFIAQHEASGTAVNVEQGDAAGLTISFIEKQATFPLDR